MWKFKRSTLPFGVGFASLNVFVATFLTAYLAEELQSTPFIFAFAAVFLTTTYAGRRSGILALVLSILSISFFIVEPVFTFSVATTDIFQLVAFLLISSVVIWLTSSLVRHARNLRDSKNELRTIIENVTEGLVVTDLEQNILHINRAARAVFGIEDPTDRPGPDYFYKRFRLYELDGKELAPAERPLSRIVGGETVEGLEMNVLDNEDGTYRIFSFGGGLIRDTEGTPNLAVLIVRDITPRKTAELALRDRESQLSDIVRTMKDALITLDGDGRIMLFNPAAEQIFGYSGDEVTGKKAEMLIPRDARHGEDDWVNETLRSPTEMNGVERFGLRKNGEEFPLDVSVSREILEDSKLYTVVLRDLTDRKQLESQLFQSQKMEAVGQLAGGIAHDFNNVITAIQGYSDLALRSLSGESRAIHYVESIKKAGISAATLTNQLLAFSRKQVLQSKTLDLNVVVKSTEPMLRMLISRNIDLELDLELELDLISADPVQLEHVILNLAINARDAMSEGGVLKISTRKCKIGPDEFPNAGIPEGREFVLLSVSDTGIGMEQETAIRIFEPFFTTKEKGKGTGLGLSTVHGIVLQSGGDIRVRTRKGQGTSFEICFPRVEKLPDPDSGAEQTRRQLEGTETIVVVEDDPAIRELYRTVLSRYGYKVLSFPDGTEALKFVESGSAFDLLLTDLELPTMSGSELGLRAEAIRPDVKKLIVSAYIVPAPSYRDDRSKRIPVISKPFTPEELAAKVREVIDSD